MIPLPFFEPLESGLLKKAQNQAPTPLPVIFGLICGKKSPACKN
jgi:hypothetical protein